MDSAMRSDCGRAGQSRNHFQHLFDDTPALLGARRLTASGGRMSGLHVDALRQFRMLTDALEGSILRTELSEPWLLVPRSSFHPNHAAQSATTTASGASS